MTEQSQHTEIFTKEIAELEAKLAAKKQELVRAGVESPEHAIFKQVVREHVTPGEAPAPTASPTSPAPTTSTRTATKDDEAKANVFIARAFTGGIKAAIAEAKKTGDAFFLDYLHDQLADAYYQKLLVAKKIKQL